MYLSPYVQVPCVWHSLCWSQWLCADGASWCHACWTSVAIRQHTSRWAVCVTSATLCGGRLCCQGSCPASQCVCMRALTLVVCSYPVTDCLLVFDSKRLSQAPHLRLHQCSVGVFGGLFGRLLGS